MRSTLLWLPFSLFGSRQTVVGQFIVLYVMLQDIDLKNTYSRTCGCCQTWLHAWFWEVGHDCFVFTGQAYGNALQLYGDLDVAMKVQICFNQGKTLAPLAEEVPG